MNLADALSRGNARLQKHCKPVWIRYPPGSRTTGLGRAMDPRAARRVEHESRIEGRIAGHDVSAPVPLVIHTME